jgi:hypothetical protein
MDQDKNNKCFICNFERFTFDKESEGGFTRHISEDHNLWYYVFYIVHLRSKDATEYTGIESYVSDLLAIQMHTWMPRQKALCLEKIIEGHDEEDEELEHLRSGIKTKNDEMGAFIERMTRLEAKIQANKKKASEE